MVRFYRLLDTLQVELIHSYQKVICRLQVNQHKKAFAERVNKNNGVVSNNKFLLDHVIILPCLIFS